MDTKLTFITMITPVRVRSGTRLGRKVLKRLPGCMYLAGRGGLGLAGYGY
jgi:hypothetical protein